VCGLLKNVSRETLGLSFVPRETFYCSKTVHLRLELDSSARLATILILGLLVICSTMNTSQPSSPRIFKILSSSGCICQEGFFGLPLPYGIDLEIHKVYDWAVIISASRRTDIPAFYPTWFLNRIKAGYCVVPNPFNHQLVNRVSLVLEDVDVVVFWTRNPRPLLKYLDELDARGYRYYFQYTLLDYPHMIDPYAPPLKSRIRTMYELAERVGPERVIWRYDPIVFSQATPVDFHRRAFEQIARALRGAAQRVVISILTPYAKIQKRLGEMSRQGAPLLPFDGSESWFGVLMEDLAVVADANGMEILSCASQLDLGGYGIRPGKCVDDDYIKRVFGVDVSQTKDPGQRKACGCVISKDIGMYDSCLFGCQYCYATSSFERSRENYAKHNSDSPSLLGWYADPPGVGELQLPLL